MAKSVSLRKPAPELPPPAAPADSEPQFLLQPGQVLRQSSDGRHVEIVDLHSLQPGKVATEVAAAVEASKRAHDAGTAELASRKAPAMVPEVRLEDLPPEKRKEYEASIQQAMETLQSNVPLKPAVTPAATPAAQPSATAANPAATPTQTPPSPPPAAIPTPPSAPTPAAPTAATLGGPQLCPHCRRDIGAPTLPEPSREDKTAFRLAFLAAQPFTRTCEVLGAEITFRTLTIQELDAVYRALATMHQQGRISLPSERAEMSQRLRLYLQLLEFRTPQVRQELPDGFTPETSPHAHAYWEFEPGSSLVEKFEAVEKYIQQEVLKSEGLFRVVIHELFRFNAINAKMEELISDPDFWQATA